MAEICCELVSESSASTPCEQNNRTARRRRMEIRRFKFVSSVASPVTEPAQKRQKLEVYKPSLSRDCENAVENSASDEEKPLFVSENGRSKTEEVSFSSQSSNLPMSTVSTSPSAPVVKEVCGREYPKFGVASVCGRRREMEDAVAIHPSFYRRDHETSTELHYFGVYDGHGCSHV